jgi:hypothetical protein
VLHVEKEVLTEAGAFLNGVRHALAQVVTHFGAEGVQVALSGGRREDR